MTFKLAAFFALSWGIMAILGALMQTSTTPNADDPVRGMINAFAQPQVVQISDPTMGDADGASTVASFWEAANTAKEWLAMMARAAVLDHPWYQGPLQVVRYLLLLLAAPFVFIVTREVYQIAMGMFRGVSGAVASVIGILSDERLKVNLKPINDPQEIVRHLRGIRFDWKDGSGTDVGLSAQEVQQIMPEAITTVRGRDVGHPELDRVLLIRYEPIVAVLLEAHKELAEQVRQLEDRGPRT